MITYRVLEDAFHRGWWSVWRCVNGKPHLQVSSRVSNKAQAQQMADVVTSEVDNAVRGEVKP